MKKLLFIFGILLSFSGYSQKAHFNSKESKLKISDSEVQFKFSVSELTSEAQATALAVNIKAYGRPVLSASSTNFSGGKADFTVNTTKTDNLTVLQKSLTAAGISDFEFDGKSYKMDKLVEVVKANKK